ncbi:ATP-binding protein [Actibacterium lipolyticum]|uniref:histidine kinase n=1 Tax=Actibacterium lipolyticum TaxID=1524263 RepID=A0A238KV32_9RHOB|nr:ATP-binding protein [Actibacterium lipolyticum]SMX46558.1 Sensor protein CreC [Actibacterium lipolyticum]
MTQVRKKWRPPLILVVFAVCALLIAIPVVTLLAMRLTSNQFIRTTEAALIEQGAIYAQAFSDAFQALDGPMIGTPLNEELKAHWGADFHPAQPGLSLQADGLHAPRPDGVPDETTADPRYAAIYPLMIDLARGARKTTLSGVVFLDDTGSNIGGEERRSFATLTEVQSALGGQVGSILRAREQDYDPHPLTSISRDTKFRVFVTYPVIADDRVIGVVYLSRTPTNLNKFLYRERAGFLIMVAATVSGTALVGFLLLRLLSAPIHALKNNTSAIAKGKTSPSQVSAHYGTKELAELGESVLSMADTLSQHAQELSIYTDHVTHELKSPVTAISGAAELLELEDLPAEQRQKLLGNIRSEASRMNTLLGRLREMTKMRGQQPGGPGRLMDMMPDLQGLAVLAEGLSGVTLPISAEHGRMVLYHMAQNAQQHGADEVRITYSEGVLRVADNGNGLAPSDANRVADPFFTTRRDMGGTGMGLAITKAILDIYRAELNVRPNDPGAVFEIRFHKV